MPDNTTSQRHAELAAEHQRKAEWHSGLAGGSQPDTPNAGAQAGGFLGAIMEHKWIFIGGLAAIIGLFLLFRSSGSQGSSTANQSPDLSQGGFVPSNISTALDSINAAISGLQNEINQQNTTTTTGTVPAGPGGLNPPPPTSNPIPNPPPVSAPPAPPAQPQPQYVTVTPWPSTFGSLWGIANFEGISLARIEQLNPQLYNQRPGSGWNLIYPGQQVRIS